MNTRRSLIDEMAAQPKPKRAKTQPNGRRAVTRYLKRMWKGAISGRPIRPAGPAAETAARQMEERGVSGYHIYGTRHVPVSRMSEDWWHPPTEWDWVWASVAAEFVPAIRRRQTKDPARLP